MAPPHSIAALTLSSEVERPLVSLAVLILKVSSPGMGASSPSQKPEWLPPASMRAPAANDIL